MERPDVGAEALREVEEETGLAAPQLRFLARAGPFEVRDASRGVVWVVHAVLARVAQDAQPRLDWEHSEARWVLPEELGAFDTVPRLAEALEALLVAAPGGQP